MTLLLFRVQPFGAPRCQRDSLKKQRLLVLRVLCGYLTRPVAITSGGISPLGPPRW